MSDRIALQNAEFDALTKLSKAWATLQTVAVVDDDYPEYRHYYERALRTFLDAVAANRPPEIAAIDAAREKPAELRKLAMAATPGPWANEGGAICNRYDESDGWDVAEVYDEANAAYIAALSPERILTLIAALRAAIAVRGDEGLLTHTTQSEGCSHCAIVTAFDAAISALDRHA